MTRPLFLLLCCGPLVACSGAAAVNLFDAVGESTGADASVPSTTPVQTSGESDSGSTSTPVTDAEPPPSDAYDGGPPPAPIFDAGAADATAVAEVDASSEAAPPIVGTFQVVQMTFYGWDDNTPPGNGIAYPKNKGYPSVHSGAGGTGTFTDPVTFASDAMELPVGTVVYAPVLEKYLVMEDDCPPCDAQWSSAKAWHVNVWMNSDGTESASALATCEGNWSQAATTIEIGAPPGRLVSTNELFDPSTNACRTSP